MKKNNIILITKEQSKDFMVFHNQTSKQDCFEFDVMNLTSLDDWSFSIVCPKGKCAAGHALEFYFFENKNRLKKMSKMPVNRTLLSADLELIAKVMDMTPVDDELVELTFDILDCNKDRWESFLKKYTWKQQKVNYIFDKYRI